MSLRQVRRSWTRLGAEDPLWAVYVAPGTRGNRWDLDAFLDTGRHEVDRTFARLAELGLATGTELALDFGCGVGRLTQPLSERFARVVGVDISPPMLERARLLDETGRQIDWVLNDSDALRFQPDASVDFCYSSLVLQHLPRRLATRYLSELVRVLRPGGLAVVQVASRPLRSVKGLAFRLLPHAITGAAQRLFLRYPAPMRMTALSADDVEAACRSYGGVVVDATDDPTYGGHWVYTRYVVRRDG